VASSMDYATLDPQARLELDAAVTELRRRRKITLLAVLGILVLFIVISALLNRALMPGVIIILPFVFWLNDPMTRWGKRWQVSRRDRNRLWRQALRARRSA
jgi:hypothetical protein